MTSDIYNTLKNDIIPVLGFKIIDEKMDLPPKIEFLISLDVHGIRIRLKKFKEDDFVYIDGFIHLERPIPEPAMLAVHSMVDNYLRIGVNISKDKNEENVDEEMIHNILIHDRVYKNEMTVGEMDHRIFTIYNCMSKVTGIIVGIHNTIKLAKDQKGTGYSLHPMDRDELKSYG